MHWPHAVAAADAAVAAVTAGAPSQPATFVRESREPVK